jgi:hypothetical protein
MSGGRCWMRLPVPAEGGHHEAMAADRGVYSTRPLSPDTWDDFARLVEANNGVWGGCWCMGFHSEGLSKNRTAVDNRVAKRAHVRTGTVHQILVYAGDECVGWCQYGWPAELPNIKNPGAYARELVELPDWRIGCICPGDRRGLSSAPSPIGSSGHPRPRGSGPTPRCAPRRAARAAGGVPRRASRPGPGRSPGGPGR